jgi:hypothetical protein
MRVAISSGRSTKEVAEDVVDVDVETAFTLSLD